MARVKTLAKAAAAGVGLLVYVWFAAVRNVGEAKRRRAARRIQIRRAATRAGAGRRGGSARG